MPQIEFIDTDGERYHVAAENGRSLMRVALQAGVSGIIADCGGCVTCGTCHVHLPADVFASLPPLSEDEDAMLDMLIERDVNSRLSCQVRVSDALDGAVVIVASNSL